MKKQLLLGTALLAAMSVFSQSNRYSYKSGVIDNKQKRALTTIGVNEPTVISPMIGSEEGSQRPAPPTSSNWKIIGGSMNAYGQIVGLTRSVNYNPNVNAVSVIHRKSKTYSVTPALATFTAVSGVIIAEVTTNWGTTWDSTALWSDDDQWGRYPEGGIYSPPGNTSIANAYVVGCGPVVEQTDFTGNWYASKSLSSFNTTASAAVGAQQFFPFNQATYPANMNPHGWVRTGFSVTDDGKVRAMGIVSDDPAGLSTMRGYAILTGTFNGATFDWRMDSIIPSTIPDNAGAANLQPDGQMAWNQAGTVGYVVGMGVASNASMATAGFQPIVYKMDRTTNAAATWTLMSGIKFNDPMYRHIVRSTFDTGLNPIYDAGDGDSLGAPNFLGSWDMAVDRNNRLHIISDIQSTYADITNVDSLSSSVIYTNADLQKYLRRYTPGSMNYVWDFVGDGVEMWKPILIDSIDTDGPSSATAGQGYQYNPWDNTGTSSAKLAVDARIQAGRSPDGKYITATWVESNLASTSGPGFRWNQFPNIQTRAIYVDNVNTTNTNTPQYVLDATGKQDLSVTGPTNLKNKATLHYMSPISSAATTVAVGTSTINFTADIKLPLTVTNSTPYKQLENNRIWFGGANATFEFRPLPVIQNTNSVQSYEANIYNSEIYPNPAQDNAVLSMFVNKTGALDINVMNSIGQTVKVVKSQVQVGQNTLNIDLTGLATGVYMVNIKTGSSTTTKKLIVE